MGFKSIGDKYRQNYCDLYPQTRREDNGETLWLVVLAALVFTLAAGIVFLARSG